MSDQTKELLPCPFHGGQPEQFKYMDAFRCDDCAANQGWLSKKEWNTRVTSPEVEKFSEEQRANEGIPPRGLETPSAAVSPDHGPDSRAGQSDQEAATLRETNEKLKALLREAHSVLNDRYKAWVARNPIDENNPSRYVPPEIERLRELVWRIEEETKA